MPKVYPGAAVGSAEVVAGQRLIESIDVREYPLRLSSLEVAARNVYADSGLGTSQVIGRMQQVDVRDFDRSVPLSYESLEDKLELAYGEAAAQVNSVGDLANIYDVFVPAGVWRLTSRKIRRGTDGQIFIAPGIVGAGKFQTTFVVDTDLGGYAIEYAPADPAVDPAAYQLGLRLEGFSILNTGPGRGGGIKLPYCVLGSIRDVRARGFIANQDYELGWGLWLGKSSDYGPHDIVPQEITVTDCDFNYNQSGIFASELSGCNNWSRVQLGGCQWLAIAADGAMFTVNGAELQAGTPDGYWYSGSYSMGMASAWTHVALAGGTGASIGVASSGRTQVNDVAGLTANHQWCWMELGGGSEPRGVYVIDQILGPTSCMVRKGSAHGAQSGLSWRVLGTRGGNRVQIVGGTYREVSKRVGMMVLRDSLTSSNYELSPRVFGNVEYGCEAHLCSGNIRLGDLHGATSVVLATQCERLDVDASIARVDVDDHTRARMTARRADQAMYLGGHCQGTTLSAILESFGVAEIIDPSLRGAVASTAGEVDSITGLRGVVFAPRSATKPIYTAADANFGGRPSWTNVDGGATTAGVLAGLIPAALLKSDVGDGQLPALLVVGRLPDLTEPPGSGKVRRVHLTGAGISASAAMHDDVLATSPYHGSIYHPDIGGALVAPQGATVFDPGDTDPHVLLITWPVDAGARVYVDGEVYSVGASALYYPRAAAGDMNLYLGAYPGIGALALDLAYVAVLRQSPSAAEARAITDAARERFGIP